MSTPAPFAPLSSPSTSTHRPPGPTIAPPPFTANFCAAAPLQSWIRNRVPFPVAPFGESRQRPDWGLRSEPAACCTHFWPPTPLQSYSCTWVSFAVPLPLTSRQRPRTRRVLSARCALCWSLAFLWLFFCCLVAWFS